LSTDRIVLATYHLQQLKTLTEIDVKRVCAWKQ